MRKEFFNNLKPGLYEVETVGDHIQICAVGNCIGGLDRWCIPIYSQSDRLHSIYNNAIPYKKINSVRMLWPDPEPKPVSSTIEQLKLVLVGDVVRLRSGGPAMTVNKIDGEKVELVWMDNYGNVMNSGHLYINPQALERVENE